MPGSSADRALAIIPALNEAPRVGEVIERILRECPGVDPLVVDDGSTDLTACVAADAGAQVVELPYNLGIGGAVQTGFRFARAHGYRMAAQVDADGQHDPALLGKLLLPIRERRADIVVGSRHLGEDLDAVSSWRRLGQRVTGRLVGLATGQALTDGTSSFRAFGPRAIDLYARTYPEGFFETLEATAIARQDGLVIVEESITGLARTGGTSSLTLRRTLFFAAHATLALGLRATRAAGRREAGALR